MTSCARGCCWTAFQVCARNQTCSCHWGDWLTAPVSGGADRTYRDPTANQAIGNVMKGRKE
jgi:hypothetical protein